MADLSHFILNSDIETTKIIGEDELEVSLSAATYHFGDSAIETTRVITVPSGLCFCSSSITCTHWPEVANGGGLWAMFTQNLDNDNYDNTNRTLRLDIRITRTSATQYTVLCRESVSWPMGNHNNVNIPAMTVKIKLVRLVPTDD